MPAGSLPSQHASRSGRSPRTYIYMCVCAIYICVIEKEREREREREISRHARLDGTLMPSDEPPRPPSHPSPLKTPYNAPLHTLTLALAPFPKP